MVKTKVQKSKPRKHPQVKKQGKQADISQFRAQLDALGLKIIQVTSDGNCFFRAIADQLEGDEEKHVKYRTMVVQYILKNREVFEPFIEDDVPFDEYCRTMESDGTWAGHMELQAASLVTHSNICIHRSMSPRWYIRNFDDCGVRMIHLSYHDGEHYNSVRLKEDSCEGSAKPIVIKADADVSIKSHQEKVAGNKSKGGAGREIIDSGSIKLVIAGTGCQSSEKIEKVLLEVDGDVNAAIEFLVAEQATEECSVRPDSPSNGTDSIPCTDRCDANKIYERETEEVEETSKEDISGRNNNRARTNTTSHANKLSKNQLCPCGSKKKYKSCCGTSSGRSSNNIIAVEETGSLAKGEEQLWKSHRAMLGRQTWERFVSDKIKDDVVFQPSKSIRGVIFVSAFASSIEKSNVLGLGQALFHYTTQKHGHTRACSMRVMKKKEPASKHIIWVCLSWFEESD